ncbi:Arylsulfotransferase (ASST) [Aquimarina amphilecti]|uniref:Arylsulfotransferase (ASST) n=1 Tax=Aquimarina amphilecti TaxID=1038014 RepID=A0A1H7UP57_AQUAM|nr:arylsulfotransferase family protein [Aquimarina amphilecti]SEL98564.1 Arylsulfotransferase (ASST) [Aquimarina amphilecti]
MNLRNKQNFQLLKFILCFFFLLSSCNNDDTVITEEENQEENEDENPVSENNPIIGETGKITILDSSKVEKGYILVNDVTEAKVYLMDKLNADIVQEWVLDSRLGNDVFLLNNGKLLASLKADNPSFDIGGYGGKVQIINPDNSIFWEFTYSNESHLSHHDIEMLPNGNILILAWKAKNIQEAENAGYNINLPNEKLLIEALIEVNPVTNQIVWEWSSWDHLIQDFDSTKDNYGNVNENPQLIDLNYNYDDRGDIMHANGIDYDPENDLIYISVNFFSEIWVIDHSTTTNQASSHLGGNFSKGGDLIYRFGNPETYQNSNGIRLFYNNHFPNVLLNNEIGAGNILMYMNGNIPNQEQSIVYELNLPDELTLLSNANNEPNVVWDFTSPDLYSPLVSGAVRLPNGNTLITEGSFGFWEVNNEKEVVWKFDANSSLHWRGYHYNIDDEAIINLGL